MVFVALFCCGMVAVGLWGGAPWYYWLPVGFATFGVIYSLITNPQSGATLTRDTLHFFHGKQDRDINLTDIAKLETHIWTDGPDDVTVILTTGEKIRIPPQCIDRDFVAAMRSAGVAA